MIPGNHLRDNLFMGKENEGEIFLELKAPKLDSVEKLYVRSYLSKLSHSYAHSVVSPGIKHPKEDNPYSRRANVQFHIARALQEKTEALEINADTILEKLYKEATREDRTASHSARINALSILGKHLGLFQEKKEVEKHTFNIIHYASPSDKIEVIETMGTEEDKAIDLDGIVEITTYSGIDTDISDTEENHR